MKVSLGLPAPTAEAGRPLFSAEAIVRIGTLAEQAGFDAIYATDHPSPTAAWLEHGGHLGLDPFVALSVVAAVTSTIGLHTNLLVLPYRNPLLTAKAVASLDVASGGRAIIGTGSGYLKGEFWALGVSFDERNDLCDEALRVMTQAWSGKPIDVTGMHFAAQGAIILPPTIQQPRPPLWVGGNSKRAIRRAVELADGWAPMGSPAGSDSFLHTPSIADTDGLRQRIEYAREAGEAAGRTAPLDIVFAPPQLSKFATASLDTARLVDEAGTLGQLGVTWLTAELPGDTLDEFVSHLERFAADTLPALRAC